MNIIKIILPVFILLLLSFTAEGNFKRFEYNQTPDYFPDTNSIKFISIEEAVDYTAQLLEGDITKAERKFKKDIPIWKVELITKDRGSFKVEISAIDKSLIRIDADEGPYDYDINPDLNSIPFLAAKKTAEEWTGLKTLKWNFYKNKNNWEYNFWLFIKSGKAQVRVNAETGEIVMVKKKK